jgi:hypothetical protein
MTAPEARLREELLHDGLVEEVSLSEVDSRVLQQYPNAPLAERQAITMDTIRSMISDGLFEVGDLHGEGGQFVAPDEPFDASMQRIHHAYVTNHANRMGWVFAFWLKLTDKGRQVATSTERGRKIAEAAAEAITQAQEFMRAADPPDTDGRSPSRAN